MFRAGTQQPNRASNEFQGKSPKELWETMLYFFAQQHSTVPNIGVYTLTFDASIQSYTSPAHDHPGILGVPTEPAYLFRLYTNALKASFCLLDHPTYAIEFLIHQLTPEQKTRLFPTVGFFTHARMGFNTFFHRPDTQNDLEIMRRAVNTLLYNPSLSNSIWIKVHSLP